MSSNYLFESHTALNTNHPNACICLLAIVHDFWVLQLVHLVSFHTSFNTVAQYDKTHCHMINANNACWALQVVCMSDPLSAKWVMQTSQCYQLAVHLILISCKVQAEQACLDEKLVLLPQLQQTHTILVQLCLFSCKN